MFFIRKDPNTGLLDFDCVTVLDAEEQSVSAATVVRLYAPGTPPESLVLRIRCAAATSAATSARAYPELFAPGYFSTPYNIAGRGGHFAPGWDFQPASRRRLHAI